MIRLRGRVADEAGATSTEYALIAALIALVVIGGATLMGTRTSSLYDKPCTAMSEVGSPC